MSPEKTSWVNVILGRLLVGLPSGLLVALVVSSNGGPAWASLGFGLVVMAILINSTRD